MERERERESKTRRQGEYWCICVRKEGGTERKRSIETDVHLHLLRSKRQATDRQDGKGERGRGIDIVAEKGGGPGGVVTRSSTPLHQAVYDSPAVRSHGVGDGLWDRAQETASRKQEGGALKEELEEFCSDETRREVGRSLSVLSVTGTGRMREWWKRQRQTWDLLC